MDAFAIGANPGWPVTHSPPILLKTGLADHKSAGAAQAIDLLFFAAMTLVFANLSSSITDLFRFFLVHFFSLPM
jgi:hypothetical protein